MRIHINWMTATRFWDFLCEAADYGLVRFFRRRAKPFRFGTRPRKRSYIPWGEGLEERQLMATLSGITEYTLAANSHPQGTTLGPHGNVWYVDNGSNKVGKITSSGTTTEYSFPLGGAGGWAIASGSDGNLWVTERTANKIAKVTTSGTFTEYALTAGRGPEGITPGPDGNLWFSESSGNRVEKITTSGTVTEYSVPTTGSFPQGITAAAAGNLW